MSHPKPPRIYVLAGVNGAGKSSIGGATFRAQNADYFNPDEAARKIRAIHPRIGTTEANGLAWQIGRDLLEKAMTQQMDFAFETTLGGNTMTELLLQAAQKGHEIYIWYAGLASIDLHLARVQGRVANGGHDIPEADIRRRWDQSRKNLIRLLPVATEVRVFDNTKDGDPSAGHEPSPQIVLELKGRRIVGPKDLSFSPDWAKPIVAAAIKLQH